MRTKTSVIALCIFPVILLSFGCAHMRSSEPRTATEVFFDTAETLITMFETDELTVERNRARETVERRRKWQCENLSETELRELGVNK